jgi:hypothetical protein
LQRRISIGSGNGSPRSNNVFADVIAAVSDRRSKSDMHIGRWHTKGRLHHVERAAYDACDGTAPTGVGYCDHRTARPGTGCNKQDGLAVCMESQEHRTELSGH